MENGTANFIAECRKERDECHAQQGADPYEDRGNCRRLGATMPQNLVDHETSEDGPRKIACPQKRHGKQKKRGPALETLILEKPKVSKRQSRDKKK